MQIINNIRIVCSNCLIEIPVEIKPGREYERNVWIYRVMPCTKCSGNQNKTNTKENKEEL